MTAPRRCAHALRVEHCPTCTTRAVLNELLVTVDQLASNLLPGTARPWRAPQVSAERRAELDRQAREDRLHIAQQGELPAHLRQQGVVVPPGESPAPYDLDIADLLVEILTAADTLAERVAEIVEADLIAWAGTWASTLPTIAPPAAAHAFADPRAHLAFLAEHAALIAVLDPDLLEHLADTAQRHIDRAAPALGLVADGQLLDALCPWCHGTTGAHPVGGARTLRVRTLPGGRAVVVCEGGRCEPDPADCGIRWRGLPAWDLQNEGEWLADRIARTG